VFARQVLNILLATYTRPLRESYGIFLCSAGSGFLQLRPHTPVTGVCDARVISHITMRILVSLADKVHVLWPMWTWPKWSVADMAFPYADIMESPVASLGGGGGGPPRVTPSRG